MTQPPHTAPRPSNTKTIARNFVFIALEVLIALVFTVLTTVAIARVIGPKRLGYFNLVMWLTSITCSVGSLGIPLTTYKYMGEFLGAGKKELARAVFFQSLRLQTVISCALTLVGLIAIFTLGAPEYRLCSILLVLSILPNMVTFVPSQANVAAENAALNTRGAFVSAIVHVVLVAASLLLGWDLVGIASAIFLSRSVELLVKVVPVIKSLENVAVVPLPPEIRRRMFNFSGLSTGLMLLQIVVWDRSDIIFLKILQSDIRQLTFFSVCFSVADRLTRLPQTFASALSATQMAEYGRDKERLFRLTSQASVYVFMGALPILIAVACLAGPLVRVAYGVQYLPAIPVLIVVAMFSIPKAVLGPAQTLLYSAEDLGFVLKWGVVAGVANIVLDLVLIPGHGATGAAWANGLAQTFAAAAIWSRVLVRYPVRPDGSILLRVLLSTAAMAMVLLTISAAPLSAVAKIGLAIPLGTLVFLITARQLRVLQDHDRNRLLLLAGSVPAPVRGWSLRLIDFIVPPSVQLETT